MQDVDLGRLKSHNGDVEPILDQQLGQCGKLDCQALPVPARALGNPVVSNHQGLLFGFA